MKVLSALLVLATVAMLGIHLTSWRLVGKWYAREQSWVKNHLSPMRVIRGEAAYWGLTLAAWPLWTSLVWRILVGLFAAIHLGGWLVAELRRSRLQSMVGDERKQRTVALAVAGFDFVEAFAPIARGGAAAGLLFERG